MRVTLVQPPQGSRFGFSKILRVEPLGLECVSSALKPHGHETHLIDLRLDSSQALCRHLSSWKPGAVGISCGFTSDVYTSLETARLVKGVVPETVVFAGGHHVSLIPGDLLFPDSPIDAVVIGEGECTAPELLDALEDGGETSDVPGVMTIENLGNGYRGRDMASNLDGLPLPDRQLSRRYRAKYHHGFRSPSAAVETTRGCPFNCNFCSIWVFHQRRARRFAPERIVEDLRRVRDLGESNVFFTDDIAFLQRAAYEELGEAISRTGLKMTFACETRADLVLKYRDLFRRWRQLGMLTIFLGIEKIDDRGLDSVRKRTKGGAATNVEAIVILREHGITPLTSMIADPGWEEDDFDRLEAFIKLLRLPNPGFTVLTPLPGTELWQTVKDRLTTTDYSYFDVMHLTLPSVLPPKRFYERFAGLYRLTEARTQIGFDALVQFGKLAASGKSFVMRRMLSAVRDMRSPAGYMAYPGLIPKPDWVPDGFGSASWVDRSSSPLVEKAVKSA